MPANKLKVIALKINKNGSVFKVEDPLGVYNRVWHPDAMIGFHLDEDTRLLHEMACRFPGEWVWLPDEKMTVSITEVLDTLM